MRLKKSLFDSSNFLKNRYANHFAIFWNWLHALALMQQLTPLLPGRGLRFRGSLIVYLMKKIQFILLLKRKSIDRVFTESLTLVFKIDENSVLLSIFCVIIFRVDPGAKCNTAKCTCYMLHCLRSNMTFSIANEAVYTWRI